MKYNALHIAHYNAYDIDFIRNLAHTPSQRQSMLMCVCEVTSLENRATIMPTEHTVFAITHIRN